MQNLAAELTETREAIEKLLAEDTRLTSEEIATRLEKDEEVVKTVLNSMYVEQRIEMLYTYQLVRT